MVDRVEMERILRAECTQHLRQAGFRGTFPHFYRDVDGFVSLVNFQFHSAGGSFCVNLSYAGPNGRNVDFRPGTRPQDLRVDQTRQRVRLGAPPGLDRWFSFGQTSYGTVRGQLQAASEIVVLVNRALSSGAEDWWRAVREGGLV